MSETERKPLMDREWVRELQESCIGDGQRRFELYCLFELGREAGTLPVPEWSAEHIQRTNPFSIPSLLMYETIKDDGDF
jgi:hypothetical protein